jgi:two-component system NarL family sensor kinase
MVMRSSRPLVTASVAALAARLARRTTGTLPHPTPPEHPARSTRPRWRLHHRGASPEALAGVAEEVARALGSCYAAVDVRDPEGRLWQVSRWGKEPAGQVRHPLTYQGEVEGALVLPAGDEHPGPGWHRALDEITADLAVAAHIWHTSHALRRAQLAIEAERKRLRRDLHDGLGPVLAAVVLQIEAARAFVSIEPAGAEAKLAELQRDARAAVDDVRRIVRELDPHALDGHSLLSALRLRAARFEQASGGRLRVHVRAPAQLPPLPREIELAVRQIAGEALTNVVRHARASECVLRLDIGADISISVVDDGVGLPDRPREGLGLSSIRERVRELDGECSIVRLPERGTQVQARLPGRVPECLSRAGQLPGDGRDR